MMLYGFLRPPKLTRQEKARLLLQAVGILAVVLLCGLLAWAVVGRMTQ